MIPVNGERRIVLLGELPSMLDGLAATQGPIGCQLPSGRIVRVGIQLRSDYEHVELDGNFDFGSGKPALSDLRGITSRDLPFPLMVYWYSIGSPAPIGFPPYANSVGVYFDSKRTQWQEISLSFNAAKWEHPTNVFQFVSEFGAACRARGFRVESDVDSGVALVGIARVIPEHFDDLVETFLEFGREVNDVLVREVYKSTPNLTLHFELPEVFSAACEQYLAGTGQFLRDLGFSEISTQVISEENRIKLTINVGDYSTVHDAIKEALSIYLALPGLDATENPGALGAIQIEGYRAERLVNNIRHLHKQLQLARQALAAQGQPLPGRQPLFLKNVHRIEERGSNTDDEPIQVLGGLVKINELSIDGMGISISLPRLLRAISRRLRSAPEAYIDRKDSGAE